MNKKKTALITGAYRGLGFEVAKELSAQGFAIFLTARHKDVGEKAAENLRASGGDVEFVFLDVTDLESARKAATQVAATVDHLDVLVNNAGIYPDGESSILTIDRALMERSFVTNAVGPVLVTQAFLPLLIKSKGARVINLATSLAALNGMGDAAPTYSISKTALNAVTRQLSAALAKEGIAVNSVCPGWVRTEMGGSSAPRSVEEGADSIVWLATESPPDFSGNFIRDRQVIPW